MRGTDPFLQKLSVKRGQFFSSFIVSLSPNKKPTQEKPWFEIDLKQLGYEIYQNSNSGNWITVEHVKK